MHFVERSCTEARPAWAVVRFEDLVARRRDVWEQVTGLLGCADAPIEALDHVEVLGSSFETHIEGKPFVWRATPTVPNFSPVGRWRSLDPQIVATLEARIGPQLKALGYPVGTAPR